MPLFDEEAMESSSPEEFSDRVHESFPEVLSVLRSAMGQYSPNTIALTKLLSMVYRKRQSQGFPGITPEELIVEVIPDLVSLELDYARLNARLDELEAEVAHLKGREQ
ncbi:Hypothetical protein PFR_JS9-2_2387 [Propionibacterium freudenreichii]|nr:Hypothetical protein PFR_JS9-1_2391 [Propionibacterium freudenreichii]SCQ71641.1 Hypothetical protein PFR_JS9-2_2387 [Propionibacterium freudenreichii]